MALPKDRKGCSQLNRNVAPSMRGAGNLIPAQGKSGEWPVQRSFFVTVTMALNE